MICAMYYCKKRVKFYSQQKSRNKDLTTEKKIKFRNKNQKKFYSSENMTVHDFFLKNP